ncbi:MAG: hypothetical protein AAF408_00810 [Pseudomonadota bacterium]
MSLDWAQAFAEAFDVSVDEILTRAGAMDPGRAQELAPGFSESDATPFTGKGGEAHNLKARAEVFGGGRPGIDIWQVKSKSLILGGYLPGDFILVDTHQSETVRAGDIVIAQKYDWQSGGATTLLRRFEPPVLIAASTDPDDQRPLIVDGNNVVVMGKVIACWRVAG